MLFLYLLPFLTNPSAYAENADTSPSPSSFPDTQKVSRSITYSDESTVDLDALSSITDASRKVTVLIDGEVKTLPLSTYLNGVLAAEMPATFPDEALRAQAVAARTYTMYKLRLIELGLTPPECHKGAALCDDSAHCKAYIDIDKNAQALWGDSAAEYRAAISAAVSSTDGEIIVYKDEPIAAVFHSASAAKTESSLDVWGSDMPYLQSVDSPGGEDSPKYSGTVTVTADKFRETVISSYPDADLSSDPSSWFKASKRSEAGGIIDVAVGGVRIPGTAIREMFSLNSTNFTVTSTENSLTFHTIGYGHGVGLSQYGSRKLALSGKNYKEILAWYYTGTEIRKMDR